MLSRRSLVMMLTMFCVVLVLFLSTAVLKEYFNDYDINHSALEEQLHREKSPSAAGGQQHVVYAGAQNTGFYQPIQEWTEYRKMALRRTQDVQAGIDQARTIESGDVLLLLDLSLIHI